MARSDNHNKKLGMTSHSPVCVSGPVLLCLLNTARVVFEHIYSSYPLGCITGNLSSCICTSVSTRSILHPSRHSMISCTSSRQRFVHILCIGEWKHLVANSTWNSEGMCQFQEMSGINIGTVTETVRYTTPAGFAYLLSTGLPSPSCTWDVMSIGDEMLHNTCSSREHPCGTCSRTSSDPPQNTSPIHDSINGTVDCIIHNSHHWSNLVMIL